MKMKTLVLILAAFAFVAFFGTGAIAQEKAAQEKEAQKQTVHTEKAGTLTATIQAIDLDKRIVTVKGGAKGEEIDIKVDEKVKNLSSLKVGDRVKLKYYASVAYRVAKPGEVTEPLEKIEVKRTAAQARQVTVTATLHDIDKNTNNIVLKGPGGNLVGVKVKDPTKLENVKVGDQLVITYTEALAVGIEKAK
jgi:biopolymer transport protein ExbD